MRILITSTDTDVGKAYVIKHLYHVLKTRGHRVCIFKPFQTEERRDGTFPDLEVFKNECDLSYDITSPCIFEQPVSPHPAFKMTDQIFLNKQRVLGKVKVLDREFDFILIEGVRGIAVLIYESTDDFYMIKGLINDCADCVISVLPSKLGAISDAIVHQDYVNQNISANNLLIMNRHIDSYIERDNRMTIGKLANRTVYIFEEYAMYKNFSEAFLKQLIGVKNESHATI